MIGQRSDHWHHLTGLGKKSISLLFLQERYPGWDLKTWKRRV